MGTRENEAFDRGREEGRKSDVFSDWVHDSNPFKGDSSTDRARDGGYKEGVKDRYEGRGSDNDSSGSSSSDSGACCYITTACLDAMGLPIDSLEMRAMKTLTKEHILKSFSGKRDYILYGRKAPKVVEAIKTRSDSNEIWKVVYETLREITSTVLSMDYGKAHQQYRELVLGLESKYA